MTKVAFLGIGLMGAPMAANILKAGFDLTVWNRSPGKTDGLASSGASVAKTPAEAVAGCDIAIAIVSDGAAVSDLLTRHGVADAMPSGAIFIDMSSITPGETRAHAETLQAVGANHLDAPVSGGTKGAEDATLAIMVGGEEAVFERARPVLEAMGRPVRVGPSGAGQLAKLANQAIVGVTIGVVAEATLLVQSGGGDVEAFREALKGGFADSKILQIHGARMQTGDYTPGGKSSIQLKDMNNIVAEAQANGIKLPLCEDVRARYEALVDQLNGAELDHAALFVELTERAQRQ